MPFFSHQTEDNTEIDVNNNRVTTVILILYSVIRYVS